MSRLSSSSDATAVATQSIYAGNDNALHLALDKGEKPDADNFEVRFQPGDPSNPKNWSALKKWYLTLAGGLFVFNATFASSAPSSMIHDLMNHFGFSLEVAILSISLFVAGYCVGPLVWGPLSEQYGRRPVFLVAFFCYSVLQVGTALVNNGAGFLILRFLGGTFAAAPLTNVGALISDIWDARTRGKALAIFTLAPFAGPALGPIASGYVSLSSLSWRWVFWITTIFSAACFLQVLFTITETYAPVILVKLARRKRKETGDERYYAPMENDKFTFLKGAEDILAKPFKILFQEPMMIAIAIYMSFLYGCIYLLFEAYPVVFTKGHHFNAGTSGLMFLPIPIGGAVGVLGYLLIFNPQYEREVLKHAPHPVPPEFRLELGIYAAPLFAISFFWFAWTSFPSVSFVAPMLAGGLMGFSTLWLFLALLNYVIDAYLFVAASALASTTVLRSLAGAIFPLFTSKMFETLGPQWAASLIGFVALAMMPIPIVLKRYGATLRKKSKYAPKTTIERRLKSDEEVAD